MDELDYAFEHEQLRRSSAISKVQRDSLKTIPAPKVCFNCFAPIPAQFLCLIPRRWCDADCCSDWQKRGA